jgi:hypothetical protein
MWYSQLNCPTLLGEEPTRVAAAGQCSCDLVKTTALNTLHKLSVSYLRPQLQPPHGQKEPNTTHKPVTWWDHIRAPTYIEWPIRPKKMGKKRNKNPPAISTPSCPMKGTKPRVLSANTRIGHQRNNWNFYEADWISCCCCTWHFIIIITIINFTGTIFLLLFLSPLHSPLFLCYNPCSPSKLLFLPLLIHSLPIFASPSYPSSTYHYTTSPSYTLTPID